MWVPGHLCTPFITFYKVDVFTSLYARFGHMVLLATVAGSLFALLVVVWVVGLFAWLFLCFSL